MLLSGQDGGTNDHFRSSRTLYHMPCASHPVECFTDIISQKLHESRTPKPGIGLMERSVGNACTQGPIGEAGGLGAKSRQGKRPDLRRCELGWAEEENPSRAQAPLSSGPWALASLRGNDARQQVSSWVNGASPHQRKGSEFRISYGCVSTQTCVHTHSRTHTHLGWSVVFVTSLTCHSFS